ncbi:hypothetical protein BC835DRAFT_1306434 [Cytidiella melzeri]|nr:hypothetical protein BC835DRAFT_1306434 [Cytidiella melzeri]
MLCLVSTFKVPINELLEMEANVLDMFSNESRQYAAKMPNAIQKQAKGCMCYSVPVIVFMDDVSGNVSKQWNKPYVVYASNVNLPWEMIEKEFSVRFVSLSSHASPMELAKAVCDSISLLCCTCKVVGTQAEKASLQGFSALFLIPLELRIKQKQKFAISSVHLFFQVLKSRLTLHVKHLEFGTLECKALLTLWLQWVSSYKNQSLTPQGSPRRKSKQLDEELDKLLKQQPVEDWINPLLDLAGHE